MTFIFMQFKITERKVKEFKSFYTNVDNVPFDPPHSPSQRMLEMLSPVTVTVRFV